MLGYWLLVLFPAGIHNRNRNLFHLMLLHLLASCLDVVFVFNSPPVVFLFPAELHTLLQNVFDAAESCETVIRVLILSLHLNPVGNLF